MQAGLRLGHLLFIHERRSTAAVLILSSLFYVTLQQQNGGGKETQHHCQPLSYDRGAVSSRFNLDPPHPQKNPTAESQQWQEVTFLQFRPKPRAFPRLKFFRRPPFEPGAFRQHCLRSPVTWPQRRSPELQINQRCCRQPRHGGGGRRGGYFF